MLKKYSLYIIHSAVLFLFLFCYRFLLGTETVSILFLILATGITLLLCFIFFRLKASFFLTVLSGLLIPPIIHFFLAGFERILSLIIPSLDDLLISFDSNIVLYFFPLYILFFLTFLISRYPRLVPINTALFGVFLLIVSHYKKAIDHLFTDREFFLVQLSFGIVLFILCFFLFVLARSIETSSEPKETGKIKFPDIKRILLSIAVFILFLLGGFFLLTKIYTSRSLSQGGGLMQSDLFRFDFSDLLSLESKIEMSDDLILLFRKEGSSENYKIRRFVLNGYSPKKGFFRDPRGEGETPEIPLLSPLLPASPQKFTDPDFLGRVKIEQEYYLLNISGSSFLSLNYPINVIPYQNWGDSSFKKIYKTESKVPDEMITMEIAWIDEKDFRPEREFRNYYTKYGDDPEILRLAEKIIGNEESIYNQAKLIEHYLKENYFYSLHPGLAPDGDQLRYFLFETKKGYCSYFAFAMTLLCRSKGIPARIAVGFSLTPESEVLNFYPVLANQAHAWVEVYFDEYGWIEFDPTSQTLAPGEDIRFGEADPEEFISLLEEILKNRHNLNPELSEPTKENRAVPAIRFISQFLKENRLPLFIMLLSLLFIIYLLLRFRFLIFFGISTSPDKKTKYLFRHCTSLAGRIGFRRKKGETALSAAKRCDNKFQTALSPLTEIYLKSLFSPRFSQTDYRNFLEKQKDFYSSLKILPKGKKLLLVINPVFPVRRIF